MNLPSSQTRGPRRHSSNVPCCQPWGPRPRGGVGKREGLRGPLVGLTRPLLEDQDGGRGATDQEHLSCNLLMCAEVLQHFNCGYRPSQGSSCCDQDRGPRTLGPPPWECARARLLKFPARTGSQRLTRDNSAEVLVSKIVSTK